MKKEARFEMSRDEAIAYLSRKGKEATEENIAQCMKRGKVYGDPCVVVDF